MEMMHRFRSKILGLVVFGDRLYAATERGLYRLDANGKRWRKVAPFTGTASAS